MKKKNEPTGEPTGKLTEDQTKLMEFARKMKELCDEYGYDVKAVGSLEIVKKK